MSDWRGLKEAQRRFPLTRCNRCRSKRNLERHHRDRNRDNNRPSNVEILCSKCHHQEHRKLKPVSCRICRRRFQPRRTSRSTLCGRLRCHRLYGHRVARRFRRSA